MSYIERICIQKNLKLTAQKRIIAEIISNAKDHPDIEKIYARANKMDSKISLATLYGTLNLFEQFSLVKKLKIGEGKTSYERYKKTNEHFHLVNIQTGEILEFKSKQLKKLKIKIAADLGFKLVTSKLELYGIPIK